MGDFRVKRVPDTGDWSVHLPHQCDAWDIAGEADNWDVLRGVSRESAVQELESFLADGAEALAALKRGEEYGA